VWEKEKYEVNDCVRKFSMIKLLPVLQLFLETWHLTKVF